MTFLNFQIFSLFFFPYNYMQYFIQHLLNITISKDISKQYCCLINIKISKGISKQHCLVYHYYNMTTKWASYKKRPKDPKLWQRGRKTLIQWQYPWTYQLIYIIIYTLWGNIEWKWQEIILVLPLINMVIYFFLHVWQVGNLVTWYGIGFLPYSTVSRV
jgi:hypothetical protein